MSACYGKFYPKELPSECNGTACPRCAAPLTPEEEKAWRSDTWGDSALEGAPRVWATLDAARAKYSQLLAAFTPAERAGKALIEAWQHDEIGQIDGGLIEDLEVALRPLQSETPEKLDVGET